MKKSERQKQIRATHHENRTQATAPTPAKCRGSIQFPARAHQSAARALTL